MKIETVEIRRVLTLAKELAPEYARKVDGPLFRALALVVIVTWASISVADAFRVGRALSGGFLVSGILAFVLVAVFSRSAIALPWANGLNWFATWLATRGAFTSDSVREAPKFALIRMVFGLFLLDRAMAIAIRMPTSDWTEPQLAIPLIAVLVMSCMLVAGLLTQVTLVVFILWDWQLFERWMKTSTLGNDIAAMLAILLLLASAGAHYSLDARLRRRNDLPGRVIRATYFADGITPNNVLQLAKFITLGSYWLVCSYSLMMHLSEDAWMTGLAGPHLLTSPFMSRFSDEMIWLLQAGGDTAILLARISLWAMLPWYLLVLPGVLMGGWMRHYIILWGILFFLLSLIVLQLGWLAEFEFLFWAGLFIGPALLGRNGDLNVAYDDRCNLCDRTVNFIRRIDLFGRVALRPVSQNKDWLAKHGIAAEDALTDLYGVEEETGRMASGYRFYELLTRKLFLLWPLHPLLVLGRWLWAGPAIYRFIADRRTRLFGVCQLPTPKPDCGISTTVTPDRPITSTNPILPIAAHWIVLSVVYLCFIPAPFAGYHGLQVPEFAQKTAKHAVRAAHFYGITPIDVFNRADLRMSENWFTLSQLDETGTEHLLPVFNHKGQRLNLHRSDRVYFGHTLAFRRVTIDKTGCHFEDWQERIKYIAAHAFATGQIPSELVYTQYLQPLAKDEELLAGVFKPDAPKVVCRIKFPTGT